MKEIKSILMYVIDKVALYLAYVLCLVLAYQYLIPMAIEPLIEQGYVFQYIPYGGLEPVTSTLIVIIALIFTFITKVKKG